MSSISSSSRPSSPEAKTFVMTSRDVCNCANPEICVGSTFCPCLVLREIAQNIGYEEPIPTLFCLTSYPVFLLCGAMMGYATTCAVVDLAYLGSEVAERRGLVDHSSMEQSCLHSLCNVCTCYMCRVLHESRLYKQSRKEEIKGIQEEVMERGGDSSEDDKQINEQSGGKIDYRIQIISHHKFLESKEKETRRKDNENFTNKTMGYINDDIIQSLYKKIATRRQKKVGKEDEMICLLDTPRFLVV